MRLQVDTSFDDGEDDEASRYGHSIFSMDIWELETCYGRYFSP